MDKAVIIEIHEEGDDTPSYLMGFVPMYGQTGSMKDVDRAFVFRNSGVADLYGFTDGKITTSSYRGCPDIQSTYKHKEVDLKPTKHWCNDEKVKG